MESKENKKSKDVVDFIIDYESGLLKEEEIISGFQNLIDTGIVWQLQGHYGRMASTLIKYGHCHA
jgi:hypothetical protein